MNYVIGSGPTGIAAAAALLRRGLPVTMLDAGGQLEPELQNTVKKLSQSKPESWDPSEVQAIRGRLRYNTEGAPLKLAYGSDYPYRDTERLQPVTKKDVDAYRSFAAGGLSTLWGASVLPYTDHDLQGWPIRVADLNDHYLAVLRMTGLSAERDELEKIYPLLIEPTARLRPSAQAQFILRKLRENSNELGSQNIAFGGARAAISESNGAGRACVYCGMCLYGCPYGLIYSSELTLHSFLENPNFKYISDKIVRSLDERDERVTIRAFSRKTQETETFEASRVFLAAGTFASTAIMLETLGAQGQPVNMKQSDHFLLPLFLKKTIRGVAQEPLHTLSQIFIEIMDHKISRHTVHLQLYTYNDFYSRIAKNKLGPFYSLFAPIFEGFFERMILVKGYIHSEESSGIKATLSDSSSEKFLNLEAVRNPEAKRIVRSVADLLSKNSKLIGASPLRMGLRLGLPGSGVHVGGSFPMSRTPGTFETDILGRPVGSRRIHVVDSSVFPSVPAPTITLTAMANAHRIASQTDINGENQ